MDKQKDLQSALDAAREFLNEKISFEEFLSVYPDDSDDKEVNELLDLIELQPKLGGFFGVSQKNMTSTPRELKRPWNN